MIALGSHFWPNVREFVAYGLLVVALVALMVAAERRDRADRRRAARRARSPYPTSHVRRIPR